MSLIQDIIAKHIPDKKGSYVFVSRLVIAIIAREYRKSMQQPVATKSEIEKSYSNGYKQGYLDCADELYDKAMFNRWKEHVAGPTENNACFTEHSRNKEIQPKL